MKIKSFYRKYPIRISIFLVTLIFICWFITTKFFPRENEHLNGLPERDIIFQVTSLWGDDNPKYTLGFVNADGSGLEYFTIPRKERWTTTDILRRIKTPIFPIITSDQSIIVFRLLPNSSHAGELVVYLVGEEANICNLFWGSEPPTLSHNESKVVVDGYELQLGLFDLSACKGGMDIADMVVVDMIPDDSYIHQGSLSPDGSLLAYPSSKKGEDKDTWDIYVHNLETNKIVTVGTGIFPIWSPDGEQIAYIGKDGIYVVNKDGSNERKVIGYVNPDTGGRDAMNGEWPPFPSWSPDGRWLVYHKCTVPVAKKSNCFGIEDYSIFKVNIETGEEYKIMDGGLNPYWRK